jgi:hypothetical protein
MDGGTESRRSVLSLAAVLTNGRDVSFGRPKVVIVLKSHSGKFPIPFLILLEDSFGGTIGILDFRLKWTNHRLSTHFHQV